MAGSFTPATVGQKLIAGDGVKTHSQSEARIDISFNTASRITRTTPNTIWRLGNFGVGDDTIIELAEGKIFLLENTADGEERPIKIITPAGTASPRGTWLSVQYDAKKGVTEVQCFRGVCELENEFGKQIMTDEEKSEASVFAAPSRPVVMDESELIDFAGLPEAQSGEIAIPPVQVVPIRTVLADIPAESLAVAAIPAPLTRVVDSLPSPKPAARYLPTPVAKPTSTPPQTTPKPVVQVEPVIVAPSRSCK